MRKFCAFCGREMADEDFLCPNCGAVWGDQSYHVSGNEESATLQQEAVEPAPEAEAKAEEQPGNKTLRWLLPVMAVCLLLTFVLIWINLDGGSQAGEGTTVPSDVDSSSSVLIWQQTSTYTVTFVDPYGNPVEGVCIDNLWNNYASSYLPDKYTYSDSSGTASFTLYNYEAFYVEPYVHIVSVPEGYNTVMEDVTVYYDEGKTHMQIVLLPDNGDSFITVDPIDSVETVYTVTFYDDEGCLVEGVCILNPNPADDLGVLRSDENGQILFDTTLEVGWVEIFSVPSGYDQSLAGSCHYFVDGDRNLKIVLDKIEATPPVDQPGITYPTAYRIYIEDTSMFCGVLPETCRAGNTATVRVLYEQGTGVMLFANGEEVTDYRLVGETYWKFSFTMPDESVTLTLRFYDNDDSDEVQEELIRAWYRQNPYGMDGAYVQYSYGTYGDAAVALLKCYASGGLVTETAAGYTFTYPSQYRILVLAGGQLISLESAYQQGYLIMEDVLTIHRMHEVFMLDNITYTGNVIG